MSALTDRLTEDDVLWLARMTRIVHARRAEAARERERAERERVEGDRLDVAGDAHDAA